MLDHVFAQSQPEKMVKSPMQENLSEHKKALLIRYQRIQQREWVINQKRQSYSTNQKPTRSSLIHQISRSEFEFEMIEGMRKMAPFSNQLEDIPKLVHDLDFECNPFHTVHIAAFRFRQLLSARGHPPIDQVIDSGAVQYFVQYLDVTNIEKYCQVRKSSEIIDPSKMNVISLHQLYALQYEIIRCITIVVSGTSDHVKYIVELGCVPLLFNLMTSEASDVRRQCVWAIGNIAGDSEGMRNYVIELGVMEHLLKLMNTDQTIPTKRHGKCENNINLIVIAAVWAISNLFRGKPVPEWDLVESAIPILCQLISTPGMDDQILTDAW